MPDVLDHIPAHPLRDGAVLCHLGKDHGLELLHRHEIVGNIGNLHVLGLCLSLRLLLRALDDLDRRCLLFVRFRLRLYLIINWFRRLVLAPSMQKLRIDAIRLKLMKIASRVVHTGRYTVFKLCSSCPYQKEFTTTLENIQKLSLPLLE